jgi:hypothetical protein
MSFERQHGRPYNIVWWQFSHYNQRKIEMKTSLTPVELTESETDHVAGGAVDAFLFFPGQGMPTAKGKAWAVITPIAKASL